MYIHIGEDVLVRARDIVAIIDKEKALASEYAEERKERLEDSVVNLAKGSYKSVVITTEKIYFSPLSSGTLKKRSHKLSVHEF
ncbi:hypothetical protein AF332_03260 [Sporosarcina globispora]|uniref:DUF370 domain-containing protein n=1 Tax=Sporosarcina globispora TaxID=1459 RepID=A0A0M0G8S1_SPOGL|nr:extracellular matrix/biofilm biosynthesis regulator RemA family protein [Sporosarcina globispora]KON85922.1 hypothetical protein AF332_03260 [Sporosarcina globispora]